MGGVGEEWSGNQDSEDDEKQKLEDSVPIDGAGCEWGLCLLLLAIEGRSADYHHYKQPCWLLH